LLIGFPVGWVGLGVRTPHTAGGGRDVGSGVDEGDKVAAFAVPPSEDPDIMDGGLVAAGEWSMQTNPIETKDMPPVDESDDPKLKLRLERLACDDIMWEDPRTDQKYSSEAFLYVDVEVATAKGVITQKAAAVTVVRIGDDEDDEACSESIENGKAKIQTNVLVDPSDPDDDEKRLTTMQMHHCLDQQKQEVPRVHRPCTRHSVLDGAYLLVASMCLLVSSSDAKCMTANRYDTLHGLGKCNALIASAGYSCEGDFGSNMRHAGDCDLSCGFNDYDTCGGMVQCDDLLLGSYSCADDFAAGKLYEGYCDFSCDFCMTPRGLLVASKGRRLQDEAEDCVTSALSLVSEASANEEWPQQFRPMVREMVTNSSNFTMSCGLWVDHTVRFCATTIITTHKETPLSCD
jgi:hypothetical protein